MHPTENYNANSGGDIPLPPDSPEDTIVSLGLTLKFIAN